MKQILKRIFFICLALVLLTLFTPLDFQYPWLKKLICISAFLLIYLFIEAIRNRRLKTFFTFLQVVIAVPVIFILFITGSWKTVGISHRLRTNSTIYIAQQMMDVGARGYSRRIVKVIPVTPLFAWINPVDTIGLDSDWTRVNEDYNPFNWKGG